VARKPRSNTKDGGVPPRGNNLNQGFSPGVSTPLGNTTPLMTHCCRENSIKTGPKQLSGRRLCHPLGCSDETGLRKFNQHWSRTALDQFRLKFLSGWKQSSPFGSKLKRSNVLCIVRLISSFIGSRRAKNPLTPVSTMFSPMVTVTQGPSSSHCVAHVFLRKSNQKWSKTALVFWTSFD
jgi:hypothetical protein